MLPVPPSFATGLLRGRGGALAAGLLLCNLPLPFPRACPPSPWHGHGGHGTGMLMRDRAIPTQHSSSIRPPPSLAGGFPAKPL